MLGILADQQCFLRHKPDTPENLVAESRLLEQRKIIAAANVNVILANLNKRKQTDCEFCGHIWWMESYFTDKHDDALNPLNLCRYNLTRCCYHLYDIFLKSSQLAAAQLCSAGACLVAGVTHGHIRPCWKAVSKCPLHRTVISLADFISSARGDLVVGSQVLKKNTFYVSTCCRTQASLSCSAMPSTISAYLSRTAFKGNESSSFKW